MQTYARGVSNLERDPREVVVADTVATLDAPIVLAPRDVPLGGPRAMRVRRTLPSRTRSTIGAWCFLDHYGPEDVADTGGMRVPPHPHTGLQTVSWLFAGEIEHRDSVGSHTLVHPGEVNLMTAGSGISHSERSTAATSTLHGVQLWVALPERDRFTAPFFERASAPAVDVPGGRIRVFVGSLPGVDAPVAAVTTFTRLCAAQLDLDVGASFDLELDPRDEYGILVDAGSIEVEGTRVERYELLVLPHGCDHASIAVGGEPVRALVIGGEPLGERILMWWNFVGRTHEEVVEFRRLWQDQLTRKPGEDPIGYGDLAAQDYDGPALPAPQLPSVRLRPRD